MEKLLRKFRKLENNNDHTNAALLLARTFGTVDEVESLVEINKKHLRRGHILYEEIQIRSNISSKYYKLLHMATI